MQYSHILLGLCRTAFYPEDVQQCAIYFFLLQFAMLAFGIVMQPTPTCRPRRRDTLEVSIDPRGHQHTKVIGGQPAHNAAQRLRWSDRHLQGVPGSLASKESDLIVDAALGTQWIGNHMSFQNSSHC